MSLTFTFDGTKVNLVKSGNTKELTKDVFVELLQITLSHISPNRDYTSITSINKLLKTIDLECEPDESDDEEAVPSPEPVKQPVKTVPVQPQQKSNVKAVPKKQPVRKDDPDTDEDDDDDD